MRKDLEKEMYTDKCHQIIAAKNLLFLLNIFLMVVDCHYHKNNINSNTITQSIAMQKLDKLVETNGIHESFAKTWGFFLKQHNFSSIFSCD